MAAPREQLGATQAPRAAPQEAAEAADPQEEVAADPQQEEELVQSRVGAARSCPGREAARHPGAARARATAPAPHRVCFPAKRKLNATIFVYFELKQHV